MAGRLGTIITATLVAGTLQLSAAFVLATLTGRGLFPVLRGVAAGPFGQAMREAGWAGATVGAGIHFVMILAMASIYMLAAERLRALAAHPLAGGAGYGLLLYLVIYGLGMPTALPQVTGWDAAAALLAYVMLLGIPIALIEARRR